MSKLLILGAGASYGSETDKSLVPPLAADLFDELLKFEPQLWSQIPKHVADLYRRDFEQGWLALAKEMPGAQTHCQRSMAAFFYRYGPTPDSLYAKLAKRIPKGWSGAIATLNYERMLQLAFGRTGISMFCGDPKPPGTELCLPHGCCHLFCDGVQASAVGISMTGHAVSTRGAVTAVDEPREFWARIKTQAFPPVMSYFEPSKFTTSGANFIENQRAHLQDLIKRADKIAIIGIAVREGDAHIWGELSKASAAIYYCSGKSAKAAYQAWAGKSRPSSGSGDVVSARYWAEDFDLVAMHLGI